MERDVVKHFTLTDLSNSTSPYRLPIINNFITPVPPPNRGKEGVQNGNKALRGRRLRPTTTPSRTAENRVRLLLFLTAHQSNNKFL